MPSVLIDHERGTVRCQDHRGRCVCPERLSASLARMAHDLESDSRGGLYGDELVNARLALTRARAAVSLALMAEGR